MYNVTLRRFSKPLLQWKNNKYYMCGWVCACVRACVRACVWVGGCKNAGVCLLTYLVCQASSLAPQYFPTLSHKNITKV